jgi:hypothetical protein
LPEKKVTPAGQALTPQSTEEPTKPKAINKRRSDQTASKRDRNPAHRQARPTPGTDKAVDLQRGK